ncbi:hypothetical protein EDM56_15195 [Brevibacillus fluminis]|uniref:Uncharacterized protein n=1 Tax=Brevibacillus fluminis TaxID=511487 RepID=A0A3M8DFZ0_9BACL|nr:hypothetical protein [Brevibacillus fluminis]RNB87040.1 hypothetical protein EDM56_15195 [Brevibacillus fluminis]
MFSKAKTGMVMSAVAAVLSIGSIGSAFAATADTTTQTVTAHKVVMNGWDTAEKGAHAGKVDNTQLLDGGQFGDHGHGRGFGKGFANNAELLALLKLDADQLQEQLKAGKSLAEIAQAQGVSTDALTSLLAKQRDQKLTEAVKNGKLTKERADRIKVNSAERIKQFVESKHNGRMHGKGSGLRNNEELLALLKLDADQLKEQLKAGKSLAEVAQAQGVSKADVIKLLIAQRTKKLDEAVASGKLTQEKAKQIKSELADRINRFVEKKFDRKDGHNKEKGKASRQE